TRSEGELHRTNTKLAGHIEVAGPLLCRDPARVEARRGLRTEGSVVAVVHVVRDATATPYGAQIPAPAAHCPANATQCGKIVRPIVHAREKTVRMNRACGARIQWSPEECIMSDAVSAGRACETVQLHAGTKRYCSRKKECHIANSAVTEVTGDPR